MVKPTDWSRSSVLVRLTILGFAAIQPFVAAALDYYWVGGSGNWSELNHWATTSGGNIRHDQIPTASDQVFFDSLSFSGPAEVILDLDNIFTGNLDFRKISQQVTVKGANSTVLNIYGSLYMHDDVSMQFKGSFDFRGAGQVHEISFAGQEPFQLRFLSEGSWTLVSDVQVDSLIHIEFGSVHFDSVSVTCHRFQVFSSAGVHIDFGSARILITGNRHLLMPSYEWRESLHFVGPVMTNPGSSTVLLTGRKASIGFYDLDQVALGRIILGQAGGKHLITATRSGDFVFNFLHLKGDTDVEGALTIYDLLLDGGNVYTLLANRTQKIGTFNTATDCRMIAFLRSSESGSPAVIRAASGDQVSDYLMLQDLHVQNATYIVNQAIDLGGNVGWDLQLKSRDIFYWIRGTGEWNDTGHWSFSSGGPPSGCLPTAADDVVFDQASFSGANQSVTINVPSAFCHTMDWRQVDQPAILRNLPGRSNLSLHILGSLYLSTQVRNAFNGDVYFESPHDGNEIASGRNEYGKNVYFSSASGEWMLLDEFDVNDSLYFDAGSLISNDQEIECFDFYSESNSSRKLDLGKSIFRIVPSTRDMYLWSSFRINATNFVIDPGTSTLLAEHPVYMHFFSSGIVEFYRVIYQAHGSIDVAEPQVKIAYGYFHHDGDFRGSIDIDTLTFSPAKAYWFFMNSRVNVDSLAAHGDCDGSIFIAGYPKGVQGTIEKSNGIARLTNVMLEGMIGTGGANFIAESSQDLGNNLGWTFMDAMPRKLYWVGGDGVWFDKAHWSLSSGGPGGACVPTAIDDVFFDEHSFSAMHQSVGLTASNGPICHNLTWQNTPQFTGLYDGVINITGSLYLQPNLSYFPWNTTFRSDSLNNEIHSGGNEMQWVDMMGAGQWTLVSDIHIPYQINLWQGTFITNDYSLRTGHLHMGDYPIDFERKLVLGNSHIILEPMPIWDEQIFISSNNFSIDPGNSLTEFIGDYSTIKHFGHATLDLHDVLFSSIEGESRIEEHDQAHFNFNKLEFYNNGVILNSNMMDTLLLASGKLYKLEFAKTQTVLDHLRAIGNNCTPIGLESTQPGRQSRIFSQNASVIGDFIQMRDQIATGGAHFSAGAHSTDISNNSGWIFEDDPDFIEVGFLGPDRTLCIDTVFTFSAYNYSPQESYRWNTGSGASEITIDDAGLYWTEVKFRDDCIIRDSINIWSPQDIQVDLGEDSVLCDGDLLTLDGNVGFPYASYQWHDGLESSSYEISEEGLYVLEVEADGCHFSDSVFVAYNPIPEVSIQGVRDVCEGELLTLDATLPDAIYQWQDFSDQAQLTVAVDGVYSVKVEVGGCSASDSVSVDFFPVPQADLGMDTSLCEGEQVLFSFDRADVSFLWQDGTSDSQYTIAEEGLYWLELQQAHCHHRDSIFVDYKLKPELPLLTDTTLCEGTALFVSLEEAGATYLWNDGSTSGSREIRQTGEYAVEAQLQGCKNEATYVVFFEPPPTVQLGADQSLCQGDELVIDLDEAGVQYQWQDGSHSNAYRIRETGTYMVKASKYNCAREDTLQVIFHSIPVFSLGSTQYLCPEEPFELQPDRLDGNLLWSDGSDGPTYAGVAPGLYWLEMEKNNCIFRDSVRVQNYALPSIDLGPDTTICHDQSILINALEPSVVQYQWQDGSTSPTFLVENPGTYSVKVDDGRCPTEFSVNVQFRQCQYFSIYLPNAFTPNGDGTNDTYRPFMNPAAEIETYLFQIYSRWGERLFSTTDPDSGWDGTHHGRKYTGDVFVAHVQVEYVDDGGEGMHQESGSVMLLR